MAPSAHIHGRIRARGSHEIHMPCCVDQGPASCPGGLLHCCTGYLVDLPALLVLDAKPKKDGFLQHMYHSTRVLLVDVMLLEHCFSAVMFGVAGKP